METVIIYVDTSVFGGCYETEFAEYSNKLLDEFRRGEKKMMVSEVVLTELKDAREEVRKRLLKVPRIFRTTAKTSVKARKLALKYIEEGALTLKSHYDAMHIATATLQGADILASWNFKHMANLEKIEHYNAINKDMGYRLIKIKTPREILNP